MAFRALLFSKSPETITAMTAACESAGISAEACSDIFTAIEKVKSRAFSCVIPDWSDQPEASFLLKRARESSLNRETLGIAIADHEPTSAEMRDNRIDLLIFRPISVEEAYAVLSKACEQMKPLSEADVTRPSAADRTSQDSSSASIDSEPQHTQEYASDFQQSDEAQQDEEEIAGDQEIGAHGHAISLRGVMATALVVTAAFCLWKSRETMTYLVQTPEGTYRVLKESVAALFYMNHSGATPLTSAGSDAQQDAYFSRSPANSSTQAPTLEVAATASTLPDTRLPLPKAFDFPLPVPVFEQPEPPPVRVAHAAIPESMRNSPPIARPVVVTVNPSQMMPVSMPATQVATPQISEPVMLTEEAARARLLQAVDPVYPQEGIAQKLHGPVVLQALIARDGSVQDLKIVRGYFILGKAAIAAVKQWRFQPYTLNGHAASTQTVITVNFSYPPG